MTEGNLNTILDNFRTSASKYFSTCPPHAWQAGAFSNYCYRLNGFPDDRKARKSAALTLWTDGLRRLAKDNDIDRKSHARKLLDDMEHKFKSSENTSTSMTIYPMKSCHQDLPPSQGPSANKPPTALSSSSSSKRKFPKVELPAIVTKGSVQPPSSFHDHADIVIDHQPKKVKRRSTFHHEDRLPATAAPESPLRIPPVRQRLLDLKDTLVKDILESQDRAIPFLESTMLSLKQIRKTTKAHLETTMDHLEYIDSAMREVRQVHNSCVGASSKIRQKLAAIIDDPLLIQDDYMMTDKDGLTDPDATSSEAETVVLKGTVPKSFP